MNLFKKIFLFLVITLFVNCTDDNGIVFPDDYNSNMEDSNVEDSDSNANTEIYFTYKVNESRPSTEKWIFIHTDQGELLDYRQYQKGQTLEFEKESYLLTDKIVITLFIYFDFGINSYYKFYSTLGVDKGTVWDVVPEEIINSDITGNFDLTLNNFPKIIGLHISNENQNATYEDFTENENLGIFSYQVEKIDLYSENEYFVTFIEDKKDYKYKFLNNVQNGDDLQVDYNEFVFFDTYLEVELPQNSYYQFSINGFEDYQEVNNGNGYLFGKAQYTDDGYLNEFLDRNPLRIGYLNRYTKYRTELSVYLEAEDYTYQFIKNGVKPNQIIVPENPNLIISDESFENFEFTTTAEYLSSKGSWLLKKGQFNSNYHNITWEVDSPSDSNKIIGDLPSEFKLLFPEIDESSLVLKSVVLSLNEEEKVSRRYNKLY